MGVFDLEFMFGKHLLIATETQKHRIFGELHS